MESNVLKANEGLADRVNDLQAELAKQRKKLELCMQMIGEFSHFIPSIFEDFKYEMKKLDAEDTVVGKCESDQAEKESTIYTNVNSDSISASDDLE
jgi:hypothetical protein